MREEEIDSLAIGNLSLRNIDFFSRSFPQVVQSEPIAGFAGFLGRGFFHHFVVVVDYANRALTVTKPSAFDPSGRGQPEPFRFNQDMPQIDGAVDGVATKFVVDTGSRFSLLVPDQSSLRALGVPDSAVARVIGWGIGGAVWGRVFRAGDATFGGFRIAAPVVAILVDRGGGAPFDHFGGAVNMGAEILSKFTITFDYPHSLLYLKPNAERDSPIPADESGVWLNPLPDGDFTVADVALGSPAAEAGMEEGDIVTAVDGKPANGIDLVDLRKRLSDDPPGTTVAFSLAPPNKPERTCTVTLRDLAAPLRQTRAPHH
jgi:hypothetical protein